MHSVIGRLAIIVTLLCVRAEIGSKHRNWGGLDRTPHTRDSSPVSQSAPTVAWPAITVSPELEFLRHQTSADPGGFFDFAFVVKLPALVTRVPNTQRGYASDWRGFVQFCKEAGLCPVPATPAALEASVEFSAEYSRRPKYQYVLPEAPKRDVKASTIQRALRAIGR